MIFLLEPSTDASAEYGHSRVGIRYLVNYINTRKKDNEPIRIFLKNASDFRIHGSALYEPRELNLNIRNFFSYLYLPFLFVFHLSKVFLAEKSKRDVLKICRAFVSRHLSNMEYQRINVSDANEIIFQDFSFQSMPLPRVLRSNQIIRLRIISKPPDYLEEYWIAEILKLVIKMEANFYIATENIKVKEWLAENLGHRIYHVPWFSHLVRDETQHEDKKISDKINIVFPGSQRVSKGLLEIPQIIRSLNEKFDLLFTLQKSKDVSPEITNCYSLLSEFDNVRLLPDKISALEYNEILETSHIGILPYSDPGYIWTASGVMIDLLSSGCRVYAPRSSAVGAEILEFNLGFAYESLETLDPLFDRRENANSTLDAVAEYFDYARLETDMWLFSKP